MKSIPLTSENLDDMYTLDPHDRPAFQRDTKIRKMKEFSKAVVEHMLTDKQKDVWKMYHIDRLTIYEIAKIIGVSAPAISKILKRADKRIEKNKKVFEKLTISG
mgnify:CR=1 FL=1